MSARTILLGAGASADAEIPTTSGLMEIVLAKAQRLGRDSPHIVRAIDTALGGLRFARPREVIDVEALYQALRALSTRREHFLAPFVGVWNERVNRAEAVDTDGVADNIARSLASDLSSMINSAATSRAPRGISTADLSTFHDAMRDALATATGYVDTFNLAATQVLLYVLESCWIRSQEAERVSYLKPLIESANATPVWIGTLNYDNTIEIAAKVSGLELDRGVTHGSRVVRFSPSSKLTLAKLHGSLDWSLAPDGTMIVDEADGRSRRVPSLIFGAGNKLRITGPYLDLLLAFRAQLELSHRLDVCGYSFRDTHINYLIYSWLEGAADRRVVVTNPKLTMKELQKAFDGTINEVVSEMTTIPSRTHARITSNWYQERFSISTRTAREWAATYNEF